MAPSQGRIALKGVFVALCLLVAGCAATSVCSWNLNSVTYPNLYNTARKLTPDLEAAKDEFSEKAAHYMTLLHKRIVASTQSAAERSSKPLDTPNVMDTSFGTLFHLITKSYYDAFEPYMNAPYQGRQAELLSEWCSKGVIMVQETHILQGGTSNILGDALSRQGFDLHFGANGAGGKDQEYGMFIGLHEGSGLVASVTQQLFDPTSDDKPGRPGTVHTQTVNGGPVSRIARIGNGAVHYLQAVDTKTKKQVLLMNVRLGSPLHDPSEFVPTKRGAEKLVRYKDGTENAALDRVSPAEKHSDEVGWTFPTEELGPPKHPSNDQTTQEVWSKYATEDPKDGATDGTSGDGKGDGGHGEEDDVGGDEPMPRHDRKGIDPQVIVGLSSAVQKAFENGVQAAIICGDFGDDLTHVDMASHTTTNVGGVQTMWQTAGILNTQQRVDARRWSNLRISHDGPHSLLEHKEEAKKFGVELQSLRLMPKYNQYMNITVDKTADSHCYTVELHQNQKKQHGHTLDVSRNSFKQLNPMWDWLKNVDGRHQSWEDREEIRIVPSLGGDLPWAGFLDFMLTWPSLSAMMRFEFDIK